MFQAQLRASIFLALDEDDSVSEKLEKLLL